MNVRTELHVQLMQNVPTLLVHIFVSVNKASLEMEKYAQVTTIRTKKFGVGVSLIGLPVAGIIR